MTAPLSFDDLRTVYRAARFEPGSRLATVDLTSADVLAALRLSVADEHLDASGVSLLSGDPARLTLGEQVRVELGAPRASLGLLVTDLDELLRQPRARVAEPVRYFLREGDSAASTQRLLRYRLVLRLIALLAEAAAYLDPEQAQLVFVHEGKWLMPVDYGAADLDGVDVPALTALLDVFGADLHRDQKLAILAEEVIALSQLTPPAARFCAVLAALDRLRVRFFAGYRLFASSFSYEKVRSDLEQARLDFAARIHKVLTDIQSQLLSIPVATVIVATQMRPAVRVDSTFWSNCAVLLGAFLFAVLLGLMIRNQYRTLAVIAAEVERQRLLMRQQFPDASATFSDVFAFLGRRVHDQRCVLATVAGILVLGLGMAIAGFVYLSQPAAAWLEGLMLLLWPRPT